MVTAVEMEPGVVEITITTAVYGDTGIHWKRTLNGARQRRFGDIYIQRQGASYRRGIHTWGPRADYAGEPGIDQDECPGAMFIWTALEHPSVEAVDSVSNRKLGREMMRALRPYSQSTPDDLWRVTFRFD